MKNSWNSSMISSVRGIGFGAARAFVSGEILHAGFAEQIAAPFQFLIDALQHAQAEFAIALDRDDARVRQVFLRVAFELDALFEVDEIKLDLLRAAPQREIGDDDVEQESICRNRFCPRTSACWRVPFPMERYCNFVAPVRPIGNAQFVGGFLAPQ